MSTDFLLGKNTWSTKQCSHPDNEGDLPLLPPAGNARILLLPAMEPHSCCCCCWVWDVLGQRLTAARLQSCCQRVMEWFGWKGP